MRHKIAFIIIEVIVCLTCEIRGEERLTRQALEEKLNLKEYHQATLSPDRKLLAAVTFKKLMVWNLIDGMSLIEYPLEGSPGVFLFKPDSRSIVVADRVGNLEYETRLKSIDLKNNRISPISTQYGGFVSMSLSPDGKKLAGISTVGPIGGLFTFQKEKIWSGGYATIINISSGETLIEEKYFLPEMKDPAFYFKNNSDSSKQGTMYEQLMQSIITHVPVTAKFSPLGNKVMTMFTNHKIELLDTITGSLSSNINGVSTLELIYLNMLTHSLKPENQKAYSIRFHQITTTLDFNLDSDGWWKSVESETDSTPWFKQDSGSLFFRTKNRETKIKISNLIHRLSKSESGVTAFTTPDGLVTCIQKSNKITFIKSDSPFVEVSWDSPSGTETKDNQ